MNTGRNETLHQALKLLYENEQSQVFKKLANLESQILNTAKPDDIPALRAERAGILWVLEIVEKMADAETFDIEKETAALIAGQNRLVMAAQGFRR